MDEWEVSRTTGRCSRCRNELAEREEYYAVLVETPDGFDRKDFCRSCWDDRPDEPFCFWKARVPVRQKKKPPLWVNQDVLVNFFERLGTQSDPMRQRFRFVLALLLMRKKLLRYEQTIRNGEHEFWQMRLVATNSVHQVENPRMDEAQIAEVSAQLGLILRGEASGPIDDLIRPADLSEAADVSVASDTPSPQEQPAE